ncbi:unnamed protein product [Brassica napus]|uniref:(rape) hypothetical protein n=1 Tax=Brassica napus TaxID=3708 RepID=A0A816P4X3_BRANA|nr:unnamed protein product [Brassica napus]
MCACAGAGKILLLHISFALLLCRLSPAFVLFSSLALDFSLSSRMVSSAGYVASSDGGWFPGPLRRRGDALPIPLKSAQWIFSSQILQYCHCLVPSLDGDAFQCTCQCWLLIIWFTIGSRFIDREAYEFRQIHREPITLEVTPEVPTSEARR